MAKKRPTMTSRLGDTIKNKKNAQSIEDMVEKVEEMSQQEGDPNHMMKDTSEAEVEEDERTKTTLRISKVLLKKIKMQALHEDTKMGRLIERVMGDYLADKQA